MSDDPDNLLALTTWTATLDDVLAMSASLHWLTTRHSAIVGFMYVAGALTAAFDLTPTNW